MPASILRLLLLPLLFVLCVVAACGEEAGEPPGLASGAASEAGASEEPEEEAEEEPRFSKVGPGAEPLPEDAELQEGISVEVAKKVYGAALDQLIDKDRSLRFERGEGAEGEDTINIRTTWGPSDGRLFIMKKNAAGTWEIAEEQLWIG